jgi:hypothetical protein
MPRSAQAEVVELGVVEHPRADEEAHAGRPSTLKPRRGPERRRS